MRILLLGQGEYFRKLIKEVLSEFSGLEFSVVSTDSVESFDSDEFSDLRFLKLGFTKTDGNWQELASSLPKNLQFLISFQFPFKIPSQFLDLFENKAWNLHTAPLPQFGGWNGSSHAIIEDFKYFGPTLHKMTGVIDGGGIVSYDYFNLKGDETSFEISEETKKRGIILVKSLLSSIEKGLPIEIIEGLNVCPRFFSKEELENFRTISIDQSPLEIYRLARAFSNPKFPGAILDLGNNKKIEIKKYFK